MLGRKRPEAPRRVRLQVERDGKKRWVIGTVVGKKTLKRTTLKLFGDNEQTIEDKLLIKLSNRSMVEKWDIDVFEVVS